MDENQLKYKRLFNYPDSELQYKQYRIVLMYPGYTKKIVIRACCEEEVLDSTKERILSIKLI